MAFHGFSKRNFRDFSTNFQGIYCFIPAELSNDNLRWMLTSHEISRESSLLSIVSRAISEETLLWLLSVLIQTKRNTATVTHCLCVKRRPEQWKLHSSTRSTIILFSPVECLTVNASWQLKHQISVQTCCFNHVSTQGK